MKVPAWWPRPPVATIDRHAALTPWSRVDERFGNALAHDVTRRGISLGLWLAVLAAALPASVSAALWFEFSPSRAAPGAVIIGRSIGTGSMPLAAGMRLPLFLVAEGHDISSGVKVGEVEVDSNGDGRTTFVVPPVAAGPYEVWIRCEPCRSTSPGRADAPIGVVTVIPAPAATDTNEDLRSRPTGSLPELVVLSVVAILGSLLLYRRQATDP